jgi:quercetin dioxygenase-like cupin family protein
MSQGDGGRQEFRLAREAEWQQVEGWSGTEVLPLADLFPSGHIHRSRLRRGTRIPPHVHPQAIEYMLVLGGVVETTGERRCETGDFWITPAGVEHGPHVAITDVEFVTISVGRDETVITE